MAFSKDPRLLPLPQVSESFLFFVGVFVYSRYDETQWKNGFDKTILCTKEQKKKINNLLEIMSNFTMLKRRTESTPLSLSNRMLLFCCLVGVAISLRWSMDHYPFTHFNFVFNFSFFYVKQKCA